MLSRFEDLLLRNSSANRTVRKLVLDFLDDGRSLYRLRQVSRILHDIVSHESRRLFSSLCIHITPGATTAIPGVDRISRSCTSLTLEIGSQSVIPGGHNEKPSSIIRSTLSTSIPSSNPYSDLPSDPRAHEPWPVILTTFTSLKTLTLRLPKETPAWAGRTPADQTLLSLRLALELSAPPGLDTLRLDPIHALGILQLTWANFAPARALPPPWTRARPSFWLRLRTLHLCVLDPFPSLSEAQARMFRKVLYGYLSSFAETLRWLRFVWVGEQGMGPDPFGLENWEGMGTRGEILWRELRVLEIGGCRLLGKRVEEIGRMAPRLERVVILDGESGGSDISVEEMGMEILDGVSTRSGSVPICLDFASMDV